MENSSKINVSSSNDIEKSKNSIKELSCENILSQHYEDIFQSMIMKRYSHLFAAID